MGTRQENSLWRGQEAATPWLPGETQALESLAEDVAIAATELGGLSAADTTIEVISQQVRWANCYYSNLIEGHDTHLASIASAMQGHLAQDDPDLRDRQLEARTHIALEESLRLRIRAGLDEGNLLESSFIQDLHRRFYERIPASMRWATSVDGQHRREIIPGQLRDDQVSVGRHEPPAHESLPQFLAAFAEQYRPRNERRSLGLIRAACAHHRLLWIHPFLDGNGRIARLLTQAMLDASGCGASGLWSYARGLARQDADYKRHLVEADKVRSSDTDGRGNLSEAGLRSWCDFFLRTCLDQLQFMRQTLRLDEFGKHLYNHAKALEGSGVIANRSADLLLRVAMQGSVERAAAIAHFDGKPRTQSRALGMLHDVGLLFSVTPRAAVRLSIGPDHVHALLPGLFPHAPLPASASLAIKPEPHSPGYLRSLLPSELRTLIDRRFLAKLGEEMGEMPTGVYRMTGWDHDLAGDDEVVVNIDFTFTPHPSADSGRPPAAGRGRLRIRGQDEATWEQLSFVGTKGT
jgi:Fic family protein